MDRRMSNLSGPDGDKGRAIGASLGGQAVAKKPAPADCEHCRTMHYVTWMQHIGHKGWKQMLLKTPTAAHSLRSKIKRTGRPESRARWKEISR
jgi:hypothetical protein